jgi:hypothetical protein
MFIIKYYLDILRGKGDMSSRESHQGSIIKFHVEAAGVTSMSLAIGQARPRTGFWDVYENDMSPVFVKIS